jgi:hypothetical protein
LACCAAWSSLQNLDIAQPVEDFVGSIKNKTLVKDILEAEDKVTEFIDQFCEEAEFTESEMVSHSSTGIMEDREGKEQGNEGRGERERRD